MPGAYAHRRFGAEVLPELPRDVRVMLMQYRELYDIGLHGPDVLFYHDPHIPNGLCRLGGIIHHRSGLEVFGDMYSVVKDRDFSPMYLSYLYGCLCHFALDCMCHGYVRSQQVPHFKVETEFERKLLLMDGHDPFEFPPCGHLVGSMRNSAVVSAFYKGASARDIQKSIRHMVWVTTTLTARSGVKKKAIIAGMRLSGKHYSTLRGLIMDPEPDKQCEDTGRRLLELYKLALPLAIRLIREFPETMEGKIPPDRHYYLDFESDSAEDAPE